MLRDTFEQLRDLGLKGAAFRATWELKNRTVLAEWLAPAPRHPTSSAEVDWVRLVPVADPVSVACAMRERLSSEARATLAREADEAAAGRLVGFGHLRLDYGTPIDWQLNPLSGERWRADLHWSRALREEARVGDVKLTWELGRFPHAYVMARAAAFEPATARRFADALTLQIRSFVRDNPFGKGAHWGSGQEGVIRVIAWAFAARVLLNQQPEAAAVLDAIRWHARDVAAHLRHTIDYARLVVRNNHLLTEAMGMYVLGVLFTEDNGAELRDQGRDLLSAEADRQFYADGGYIQQSHNYHRAVLQLMLWAVCFARSNGEHPPLAWTQALERSLDFLVAHQNPTDGRLPNYGANDGSLPSLLSCCAFADFRPALQAVSLLTRGERLYDAGPWDEHAAWLAGPAALDMPVRTPRRTSVAFPVSGFNVARGSRSFAAFRCGPIPDRFTQIDMLHLDVWWNGANVLVDGGSFAYNAADAWHDHFVRTGSHNTVRIDDVDQMLHYRRFTMLYRPRARVVHFDAQPAWTLMVGEHHGYERLAGGVVHRRSVLAVHDSLWVVVDWIYGDGEHLARLHWLAGTANAVVSPTGVTLHAAPGAFDMGLYTLMRKNERLDLAPAAVDVVVGDSQEPRGWLSRSYVRREAVASITASLRHTLPIGFVSLLGPGAALEACVVESRDKACFRVEQMGIRVGFTVDCGTITDVAMEAS